MKLSHLLTNISVLEIIGNADVEIENLTQDTRDDFQNNTLYFAVPGTQVDGYDFISQAIEKRAITIVCEKKPENINKNTTYVILESVAWSMGYIVSEFYGNPSLELNVIGVTGTNGKTTIVTGLYQALLALNQKVAVFSTAGDFMNGEVLQTNKKASSSLEIIELHKNLRYALDNGCSYICIEATSHALDQYRLNGVHIKGAVYTNLTQDHLDYHPDFNHYKLSKKRLFDSLSENSFAVINNDDKYGMEMVADTYADIITYGNKQNTKREKDISFFIKQSSLTGTDLFLAHYDVHVSLIGVFNMYNIAAIYGVLSQFNFVQGDIFDTLASIQSVSGRMQIVTGQKDQIIGIVDYAHTPDALENVLKTLRDIDHHRIITVIGAGGDRDKGKRPQMARIAQKYSDYIILTSDNPRTENPKNILSDMISGCNIEQGNIQSVQDRELAIRQACEISQAGDIVLVAGKGHEDYQIIGDIKYPFSDVKILELFLQ